MDKVSSRTFWAVVGALFLTGSAVAGMMWQEAGIHNRTPYHQGLPFYVEQRISASSRDLTAEIRGLRQDIHDLREAVIASGTDLR